MILFNHQIEECQRKRYTISTRKSKINVKLSNAYWLLFNHRPAQD